MSQCFTCRHTVMHDQPRGKGLCRMTQKTHDVLAANDCKQWALAAMDSVRSRTKRSVTFDAAGRAVLK